MKKLVLVLALVTSLSAHAERDHRRGWQAGCAFAVGVTLVGLMVWRHWPTDAPGIADDGERPAIVAPGPPDPNAPAPPEDVVNVAEQWQRATSLESYMDNLAESFNIPGGSRAAWSRELAPLLPENYRPTEQPVANALVLAGIRLAGQTQYPTLVSALGGVEPAPPRQQILDGIAELFRQN